MRYPDLFPLFVHRVQDRLKRGADEYGDKTFERDPKEVLGEIQAELEDVSGWSYCTWLIIEEMKRKLPVVLLALLMWGCACVVPDWNTRGRGMHQMHKPTFRAWTAPLWTGVPGEVTIFARVNHSDWQGARLEVSWDTAKVLLAPEPDLSWAFRGRWPEGRHEFKLRVLLGGEVKAERELWVRLRKREKDISRGRWL